MRILPSIAAALAFVILTARDGSTQVPGVDAAVDAFMREENVAGVAVAIMKGDVLIHAKGYGLADVERDEPASPHTVFRIASLSKQFTAASVLMLAEQGRIDLDASIRIYFPEFPVDGPIPTVRHLLNHTSGFDFQSGWTAAAPPPTTPVGERRDLSAASLSKLFATRTFEFAPGTRFRYNNNAFSLLGLLIERISGLSYAAFVKLHIFEPLGMTESYYMDTTSIIRHRASGYTFRDEERVNAPFNNLNASFSAGALGSTALDLLKWRRALNEGGLLSDASRRQMATAGRLADGTPIPYGLGLFILAMNGTTKIDHYGNTPGFRSEIAYYPDARLTVVVLANTNPARTDVLESRISRMLLGLPEETITEVEMSPAALRPYAGAFTVTDAKISHRSVVTEITLRDDGLYAGRFRLRPVGNDVFLPVGDPYHHYTFIVRDGRAIALTVEREGRVIADARR